jgi:hypothetical protein
MTVASVWVDDEFEEPPPPQALRTSTTKAYIRHAINEDLVNG